MGRITVEVSDSVGILLPEACPLHKHKLTFEGDSTYFKHRVGTDDESSDGMQYESWNYSVPEGKVIDYVSNGYSSGGYGSVTIYSNYIASFTQNVIEVIVYLRDPEYVYSHSYTNAHGLPASTSWDTTSLNYKVTEVLVYCDKTWSSLRKEEDGDTTSETLYIGTNDSDQPITHWTSGHDSEDWVVQQAKPKEEPKDENTEEGSEETNSDNT